MILGRRCSACGRPEWMGPMDWGAGGEMLCWLCWGLYMIALDRAGYCVPWRAAPLVAGFLTL